jgi:hypothetical protein
MARFKGIFGAPQRMPVNAKSENAGSEMDFRFVSRRGFVRGMASASLGAGALLSCPGWSAGASPFLGATPAPEPALKSIKIARFETFKVVVPMKPGSVLSDDAADLEPFWHDFQKGNPEAPKFILR